MIGIVVVTHGNLAIELISAVNFVLSQEPEVKIVGVSLNPKKKFESFTNTWYWPNWAACWMAVRIPLRDLSPSREYLPVIGRIDPKDLEYFGGWRSISSVSVIPVCGENNNIISKKIIFIFIGKYSRIKYLYLNWKS